MGGEILVIDESEKVATKRAFLDGSAPAKPNLTPYDKERIRLAEMKRARKGAKRQRDALATADGLTRLPL